MKFSQQPTNIIMVRPACFGHNQETANTNAFQGASHQDGSKANGEFERMVDLLRANEVPVEVFDDTLSPPKPDAIFPNNWFSTHGDGTIVIYPMMAENRRLERRDDLIEYLKSSYTVTRILDFSPEEKHGHFLEGTGSLVLDHVNGLAYACRSPRTSEQLVRKFCESLGYKPLIFDAVDENARAIYHTNVMMAVGEKFAVLCLDSIHDEGQQEMILDSFAHTGHKVVAISYEQMKAFAGNVIEVKASTGELLVLLSQTAFHSLLPGQVNAISEFADLLPLSIPTIEGIGGGSVRCMVAGIHLPPRKA